MTTLNVGITSSIPREHHRLFPERIRGDSFHKEYEQGFEAARRLVDEYSGREFDLFLTEKDPPHLLAGVLLGFASKGVALKLSNSDVGKGSGVGVDVWTNKLHPVQ